MDGDAPSGRIHILWYKSCNGNDIEKTDAAADDNQLGHCTATGESDATGEEEHVSDDGQPNEADKEARNEESSEEHTPEEPVVHNGNGM